MGSISGDDEMKKLEQAVKEAFEAIVEEATKRNRKEEKICKEQNEQPCSVCNKTSFVLKYRDVNGKTKGSVRAHFSLFGGSINVDIDGEVHTDPILSCRECGNERRIVIPKHTSISDVWSEQFPYISDYSGVKEDTRKVSKWLQSLGIEVAIGIENEEGIYTNRILTKYSDGEYVPKFTKKEYEYLGLFEKRQGEVVINYKNGYESDTTFNVFVPIALMIAFVFILFAFVVSL